MTSVEVPPPPPSSSSGDEEFTSPLPPPEEEEEETKEIPTSEGDAAPASTYQWLTSVPLVSSAGNTVYGWYEGSKNYTRASKYALEAVESSVKYVADTAAPVIKKPIEVVDSFAVKQLVKLEEKVPVIKTETSDVLEAISEKKDAVYTTINTQKEAVSTRLANGKAVISTSIETGKTAVYNRIQSGSEAIANSRAGCLVGQGVDRTLQLTENAVEYLLPEEMEEEAHQVEEREMETLSHTLVAEGEEEMEEEIEEEMEELTDEMEEEIEGEEGEEQPSRVARVRDLSRKVKLRIYYRTLRRLDSAQQQCKSALEQLKLQIDLLKMAQSAREGVDKQYKQLQSSLSGMRQTLSTYIPHSSNGETTEEETSSLPQPLEGEEEEEGEKITAQEELTLLQGALEYTKHLSEKVYTAMHAVSKAASYLPHHLKTGTTQAFTYSQELYTTVKSAKVPTDLPVSALNRISAVVDTQLNYVKQLGSHIRTSLPSRSNDKTTPPAAKEDECLSVTDEAEGGSDDELGDPEKSPNTRPPGEGGSQSEAASSSDEK